MKMRTAAFGAAILLLASLLIPTVRLKAAASYNTLLNVYILNGHGIDNTPIGATTPNTGSFTTAQGSAYGVFGTAGNGSQAFNSGQGAYIGWNVSGSGFTDLVNNYGAGVGGYRFFNTNTTGVGTQLLQIDAAGGLQTTGNITAGTGGTGTIAASTFTGNANSANILFAVPTNCGSTIPAYGISANGNALCVAQTNRTCNANGCYKVSSDGTIQAWGTSSSFGGAVSGTQGVTFPVSFTNTSNLSITVSSTACTDVGGACGSGVHPYTCTAQRSSLTTSGVTMFYDGNGSTVQSGQCSWQAIGY